MRRPGFKINGQPGCKIHSKQPDGKVWWRTGRRTFVWDCWLQSVLAGTAEGTAEMQILGSDVWHHVEVTPDEALEIFEGYRFGGQLRIKGCTRIRERRMARGLPVCGTLVAQHEPQR